MLVDIFHAAIVVSIDRMMEACQFVCRFAENGSAKLIDQVPTAIAIIDAAVPQLKAFKGLGLMSLNWKPPDAVIAPAAK